jgi:hypothetical protein
MMTRGAPRRAMPRKRNLSQPANDERRGESTVRATETGAESRRKREVGSCEMWRVEVSGVRSEREANRHAKRVSFSNGRQC